MARHILQKGTEIFSPIPIIHELGIFHQLPVCCHLRENCGVSERRSNQSFPKLFNHPARLAIGEGRKA